MSFVESIKQKLKNLTTLEIITAVGPPKVRPDGGLEPDYKSSHAVLFTQIRLLQGDVITNIDETFITGDHQSLRDFHQARVADGLKTVKDNVAALKELYLLFTTIERDAAANGDDGP